MLGAQLVDGAQEHADAWRGRADEAKALALRAVELMCGGRPRAYEHVYHHDARTRRLVLGPPIAPTPGPATFRIAARWLTDAFADLEWVVHHVVSERDLVAVISR